MKMGKTTPFLLHVLAFLMATTAFAEGPTCRQVLRKDKGHPFESIDYPPTALDRNIPATAWKGSLMDRRDQFIEKYKSHVKLVKDVYFKFEQDIEPVDLRGTRDVLVISTKDAPPELLQDYLNFISLGTISFPLGRQGGHLYARFGNKTYDNINTLSERDYSAASNHRIETVALLSPSEFSNFAQYTANILANREAVIGNFSYGGSQKTKGKLDDNTCLVGGHNCTSWVATAGVGLNNRRVLELMGGDLNVEVGTNPGWLSLFLNTKAKKDRVPFTIFWTPSSLTDALAKEVRSFHEITTMEYNGEQPWDFYPH